MTPVWMDRDTGELYEGGPCPNCAKTEQDAGDQVRMMERELRTYRSKVTKLEREGERIVRTRHEADEWNEVRDYWLQVFPDKKPTAKGVKSARAGHFFKRREAGATLENVKDAIAGARILPYVVYGKRVKTGSPSDLADDLQDIVSVKNDRLFDQLCAVGREAREAF